MRPPILPLPSSRAGKLAICEQLWGRNWRLGTNPRADTLAALAAGTFDPYGYLIVNMGYVGMIHRAKDWPQHMPVNTIAHFITCALALPGSQQPRLFTTS